MIARMGQSFSGPGLQSVLAQKLHELDRVRAQGTFGKVRDVPAALDGELLYW